MTPWNIKLIEVFTSSHICKIFLNNELFHYTIERTIKMINKQQMANVNKERKNNQNKAIGKNITKKGRKKPQLFEIQKKNIIKN